MQFNYLDGAILEALKNNPGDYNGAISDYTKAIQIDPNYASAYSNRNISKENLGDLSGACADWEKR